MCDSEYDMDEDIEERDAAAADPEGANEEPEFEIEPAAADRTLSSEDSSLTMDSIDVQSVSSEDAVVLQRRKKRPSKTKKKQTAIN